MSKTPEQDNVRSLPVPPEPKEQDAVALMDRPVDVISEEAQRLVANAKQQLEAAQTVVRFVTEHVVNTYLTSRMTGERYVMSPDGKTIMQPGRVVRRQDWCSEVTAFVKANPGKPLSDEAIAAQWLYFEQRASGGQAPA